MLWDRWYVSKRAKARLQSASVGQTTGSGATSFRAISTCSRFSAFFGTAHQGRVAYAAGFTGLGVGATRFGADVMLDLLAGERTERTELEMVRKKPLPFPPEPFAWTGIALTKWSLARADAHGGRRNLWLKTMDRLGLGFDS